MEKYIETLKIARNHAIEIARNYGIENKESLKNYYIGREEAFQFALEQFFELKMETPYLKQLNTNSDEPIDSIFNGTTCVIPLNDVQHFEKYWRKDVEKTHNNFTGIHIITDKTKWSYESDCWENAIYLDRDEADEFIKCFMRFKIEKGKRIESDKYCDLIGKETNSHKASLDFIKRCREYFYHKNLNIHSHLTPTVKELLDKSEEIIKNNCHQQ